jgi:hypothetical protein
VEPEVVIRKFAEDIAPALSSFALQHQTSLLWVDAPGSFRNFAGRSHFIDICKNAATVPAPPDDEIDVTVSFSAPDEGPMQFNMRVKKIEQVAPSTDNGVWTLLYDP